MDITRANFRQELPEIKKNILGCTFMAFDLEFSGMSLATPAGDTSNSFITPTGSGILDSLEEKYQRWQSFASNFQVLQFGLALYKQNPDTQNFDAHVYNFNLFPSTSEASGDRRFTMQASAIEFLNQNGFDWNKTFKDGLSYLSTDQLQTVLDSQQMQINESGRTLQFRRDRGIKSKKKKEFDVKRDDDKTAVEIAIKEIKNWYENANVGEIYFLRARGKVRILILRQELAKRFPELCFIRQEGGLRVRKSTMQTRAADQDDWEVEMLEEQWGFGAIWDAMKSSKKPLIGHNMVLDLTLSWYHFEGSIPDTLTQFKAGVNEAFPNLYDAKLIALYARDEANLTVSGSSKSTSVDMLYDFLSEKKRSDHANLIPEITFAEGQDHYIENAQAHEAGYDSYMQGANFLWLAHSLWEKSQQVADPESMNSKKPSFSDYLNAVEGLGNRIAVPFSVYPELHLTQAQSPPYENAQFIVVSRLSSAPNEGKDAFDNKLIRRLLTNVGGFNFKFLDENNVLIQIRNEARMDDAIESLKSYEHLAVGSWKEYKDGSISKSSTSSSRESEDGASGVIGYLTSALRRRFRIS
eukprot:Clim_evm50s142 gene=Clim_evmTU50s142